MDSNEQLLICTHATLRFACQELDEKKFDNTLFAIDEFHHVSADAENVIVCNQSGEQIDNDNKEYKFMNTLTSGVAKRDYRKRLLMKQKIKIYEEEEKMQIVKDDDENEEN